MTPDAIARAREADSLELDRAWELTAAEAALDECCDPVDRDEPTSSELAKLGVAGEALTDLYVAPVCFDNARFTFTRGLGDDLSVWRRAVVAVIVPCRDVFGVVFDLVAWNMKTGALATLLGAASFLGEFNLTWRFGEEALPVFSTILEWLLAGCDGLVILDPKRARWELVEERLIVTDQAFGRRLREAMRLPEPEIFVRDAA